MLRQKTGVETGVETVTAVTAVRWHVRRLQRADSGHFQASINDPQRLEVAVHAVEASDRCAHVENLPEKVWNHQNRC